MTLAVLGLLALIAGVIWVVSGPLRGAEPEDEGGRDRARLELAKESKYAEIRDAELDLRTGKLSEEDFAALDRQLRAEAVEILRALDSAE